MYIKLIPVAASCDITDLAGTTAVVFDVLRATSTIVTALASGFRLVYPVAEASEAWVLAEARGFLLAGERGGEKIAGFPHGNSPLEFSAGPGAGSDALVLTTSNGTGAIHKAAAAACVLTGSLLNARAVAAAVLREGRDVRLVCAGTAGEFSLEDVLGAGFVLVEMEQAAGGLPDMDDLATAAYSLARLYSYDPLAGLRAGRHGKKLLRLGREADLRWCARLNRFDLVPVFTGDCLMVPGVES